MSGGEYAPGGEYVSEQEPSVRTRGLLLVL